MAVELIVRLRRSGLVEMHGFGHKNIYENAQYLNLLLTSRPENYQTNFLYYPFLQPQTN